MTNKKTPIDSLLELLILCSTLYLLAHLLIAITKGWLVCQW